jgi:predicted Zn-dependent protease
MDVLKKGRIGLALFAFSFSALAQSTLYWEVNEQRLAGSGINVNLRSKDGIAATLPTNQLKKLHSTKERIGSAASLPNVRLFVSSDQNPNAFAGARNGERVIVFTLGMLKLLGEDEDLMASVMGHEFGHHVKNHQGRGERQTAVQVVGVLAQIVAGLTIGNSAAAEFAGQAGQLGARAIIHSYDRDQEREADAFGVDVMARAGYDPHAATRYWSTLGDRGGGGLFSTHPSNDERIENVRQLAVVHSHQRTALASGASSARTSSPPLGSEAPAPEPTKHSTVASTAPSPPGVQKAEAAVVAAPAKHVEITITLMSLSEARSRLSNEPRNPENWLVLGRAYATANSFVDATRSINEAVRLNPGMPEALYEHGRVAFLSGDRDRVMTAYKELVQSSPELASRFFTEFVLPSR